MSTVTVGLKVGRLEVVGIQKIWSETSKRYRKYADCRCECGNAFQTRMDAVGKDTLSCGCLNAEQQLVNGKKNATHSMSKTSTYKSWAEMWARCTNKNHEKYHLYKERTPPDSWKSFEKFYEDMGEKPKGYSLERVDNDMPYSKENCKWIAVSEQGKNTSRVRYVVKDGDVYTFPDACIIEKLNFRTVDTRIRAGGKTLQEALGPGWDWYTP